MPSAKRRERHVIAANPAAVRGLLERLERGPALEGLSVDARDCTLLVLAEVLNNVVEHGYAGAPGWIGLMPLPGRPGLGWRIVDRASRAATPAAMARDMPVQAAEGGFGLPLIRALTDRVALRRKRGMNILTLEVRAEGGAAEAGVVCGAG
jgi:serine/threonine-protein kinase RsbW